MFTALAFVEWQDDTLAPIIRYTARLPD